MKLRIHFILFFIICACNDAQNQTAEPINMTEKNGKLELATLGAGCFWCVEAIFESLNGVNSVESGYSGGNVKNPSYREVCTGTTGHAEVVQVAFDPEVISFQELLEVFWQTHDPTTLNRQGADVGTQYRSVIFYHNEEQKEIATQLLNKLNEEKAFENPVVTEVSPFTEFYVAEESHQDYYRNNPEQGYCTMVIRPKVEKFKKVFEEKLNPEIK